METVHTGAYVDMQGTGGWQRHAVAEKLGKTTADFSGGDVPLTKTYYYLLTTRGAVLFITSHTRS